MLNKELNAGLADSKVRARIVELGGTVLGGSPRNSGRSSPKPRKSGRRVIKFAGIKAD
jgi:hypothetical protein